jgi:hypothetical protein
VQGKLAAFAARGAAVVAVGQGTGAEAARVASELRISFPVLGDPDHAGYDTLGLGRTGIFGLTLEPFFEAPGEAFRNLRQADLRASASPRSDVRRLAGALLVDADGRVRFLHRSAKTTDVPETEALLQVLDGLRGQPAGAL